MKKIVISFDVEQDFPPFFNTKKGFENGIDNILEILKNNNVLGSFFITSGFSVDFEDKIMKIVKRNHEIGVHGLFHERFDKMSEEKAEEVIKNAKEILECFTSDVFSFRAPNFKFPTKYYKILEKQGFLIDSSVKGNGIEKINSVTIIKSSLTSLHFRMPKFLQKFLFNLEKFESPIVLVFHNWEFVNMPKHYRIDGWFKTGKYMEIFLDSFIREAKTKNYEFAKLSDFID